MLARICLTEPHLLPSDTVPSVSHYREVSDTISAGRMVRRSPAGQQEAGTFNSSVTKQGLTGGLWYCLRIRHGHCVVRCILRNVLPGNFSTGGTLTVYAHNIRHRQLWHVGTCVSEHRDSTEKTLQNRTFLLHCNLVGPQLGIWPVVGCMTVS